MNARPIAGIALLLLLLTPALRAQEAPPADAPAIARSAEALAGRFAALREALEAELGAPFDPAPSFVPVTRREVADVIAGENLEVLSGLEGAPPKEQLEGPCRQQARALADACFGKVHVAEGHVMVVSETFAALAEVAPELAGLREPAFLDVILVHEAVHVWQDRRFGVHAFVGQPRTEEELRGRFCVLEGHAQVVTRRVAARLGLEDEFALFVRAIAEVPSSVTDPAVRMFLETITTMLGFQYLEGERFVAHVLEQLGQEAGVERLFTTPPRTLRQVSHPDVYLAPPGDDAVDLRGVAKQVLPLLPEGWPNQVTSVPEPGLRSALALAGDDADAWLKDGHRETVAAAAGDPSVPGRSLTVVLYACTSPAAAEQLLALEERVSRAKDEQFSQPGNAFRIVASTSEGAEVDDLPGLFLDKRLTTPMGELIVRTMTVARGAFVLEIAAVHHPDLDKAALQALAREVLALLPR